MAIGITASITASGRIRGDSIHITLPNAAEIDAVPDGNPCCPAPPCNKWKSVRPGTLKSVLLNTQTSQDDRPKNCFKTNVMSNANAMLQQHSIVDLAHCFNSLPLITRNPHTSMNANGTNTSTSACKKIFSIHT